MDVMSRISPLLWATAVFMSAGTSAFAMTSRAANDGQANFPDPSFTVFFDPGTAAITKEGRDIILVVAKKFTAAHGHHTAARIIVTSESDDQESASLSNRRFKAVGHQLARDGVQGKYVRAIERPSNPAEPESLRGWQRRRVSISIHENHVIARL